MSTSSTILTTLTSLRTRLVLLFFVILLPTIALTLYYVKAEESAAVGRVRTEALRLVALVAESQGRIIDRVEDMLLTLTRLTEIQEENADACNVLFARLLQQHPIYLNLLVSDVNGDVHCSGVPLSSPLNVADRVYFQQALLSDNLAMSEFQISRSTGKPSLAFGLRFSNDSGMVAGVVIAALDLSALPLTEFNSDKRAEVLTTITDHAGTIVARSLDADQWVGKSVTDPTILAAVSSRRSAETIEATGVDGITRLYALAPVPGTISNNLYVTVGIPSAVAFAEANWLAMTHATSLLLIAIVGLLAISLGSEMLILQPVRTLVRTARRLKVGDLTTRSNLRSGPSELLELSGTVDEMAGALEIREKELLHNQTALERYNRRLETLHRIDRGILAEQSAAAIGQMALGFIVDELAIDFGNLMIFDFASSTAEVLVSNHIGNQTTAMPKVVPLRDEDSINRLRQGYPILINDLLQTPDSVPAARLLLSFGLRTLLTVPLIANGQLIGSIDLGARNLRSFSPDLVQIVTEIADQLAIAIQHARMSDRIKRHAAELEQRVVERTQQLQEAKDSVEVILNNTSDAIALVTDQLVIEHANNAFLQLFEVEKSAVLGRPLHDVINAADHAHINSLRDVVINEAHVQRAELTCLYANGSGFSCELALALVSDGNAAARQLICSVHDISEHKRLETELRNTVAKERELNDLKSRFTSMVSHEFRTPLAVILASSETLRGYYDKLSIEKRVRKFEEIKVQVNRLVNLLEDVLALGKMETVDIQVTKRAHDLEMFCLNVAAEVQETTKLHQITITKEGACGEVWLDEKLMRQAVTTLLTNAVKYSPNGGAIEMRLLCETAQVKIQVQDHGIGIPTDDLARLFTMFHRARNVGTIGGTGLGLAIVRRAAEIHGGTVDVSSEEGVGTTVTITLPLAPDEANNSQM